MFHGTSKSGLDPIPDEMLQAGREPLFTQVLNKIRSFGWIFVLTVFLPTLLAILYFGIFASDVYVSESRFVVRSPDKPASSTLGVLLKSVGFSNANDEVFFAQDYIVSRDALRQLNSDGLITRAYTRGDISIFNRFNSLGLNGSFEELFDYYQRKVTVARDNSSGISTVKVQAYTPRDAYEINARLLNQAERLVNQLNDRGRRDLIRFATEEVRLAKDQAQKAALNLAALRRRENILDPEKQAAVQLQMISKLQDEVVATRNQLMQLRAFAPANTQIPVLETKLKGLVSDIDVETSKIAGGDRSLASSAVAFQRAVLENDVATKQLAVSMASLEEAQNEARRKQAYVETVVRPVQPDEALQPRRLRGILSTFVLGMISWGILSMLLAGISEHRD